jgi:hypothetical protein
MNLLDDCIIMTSRAAIGSMQLASINNKQQCRGW